MPRRATGREGQSASNVFLGREKAKPGLLGKLGFPAQKDMERLLETA
jgi:hypothetical protein